MSTQTILARIVFRRGTAAAWAAVNPVMLDGEGGFEIDTRKLKIGDGATAWNDLAYYSTGSGSGGFAAYVHTQSAPSTTWTINHNLGYRPSVELINSGSQEIDGDISHPTINQTVVLLSPPTAGLARLI